MKTLLEKNTMHYGNSTFNFRRQALLRTTLPLDLSNETSCTGFVINGTEPAGTSRRIIFEVDGKLYYHTNDGWKLYPSYGELQDVLQFGNTVGELLQIDALPDWLNKKVYPIIALDAPQNAQVMPQIKIGLKVNCYNDEYTREELSPIYELKHGDNPARITAADSEKSLNGYAQANVQIRTLDKFDNWSDWQDLTAAVNKEANAVQFKATYTLTALDGTDEAKINFCNVNYVTDSKNLAGDVQEIITSPVDYYADLGTVYALIKTSELLDADIKAYVKFQGTTKRRENLLIGTGIGELKTYYLGLNASIDPHINQNSIRLTAGGKNITDFYYNTENCSVDVEVDRDVEIFASYEYDIDKENWLPMAGQISEVYGDSGQYMSRFVFRNSEKNKRISAVKFTITRKTGKVENAMLGTATGKVQRFILEHRAMAETIVAKGDWDYDEDTQTFETTGTINDALTISYSWNGVFPKIYQVVCGWTPLF